MKPTPNRFEQVLVGLVVVTVCLTMIGPILTRLVPVLVVLGVLAMRLASRLFPHPQVVAMVGQ